MKISLEFENRLIELFGSEHTDRKNTFEKVLEPKSNEDNSNKFVDKTRKKVKGTEESQKLPSGFTLFMGIGIGIGLASHAVLTKTN